MQTPTVHPTNARRDLVRIRPHISNPTARKQAVQLLHLSATIGQPFTTRAHQMEAMDELADLVHTITGRRHADLKKATAQAAAVLVTDALAAGDYPTP